MSGRKLQLTYPDIKILGKVFFGGRDEFKIIVQAEKRTQKIVFWIWTVNGSDEKLASATNHIA